MPRARLSSAEHNARYGWPHRNERARRLAAMHDGDPCCRCGRPMFRGQSLHVDHAPDGGYLGLSHEACNTRAGARLSHASRRSRRPRPRRVAAHPCDVHGGCREPYPCW